MTISIRGVTHYSNGELDFISLQEWQRDQEMYRKIIMIPFFERYGHWKMFSVWKRVMRDQRFRKCAKTLNSNLFILDRTLRDSLLQVRKHCIKITEYKLIDYEAGTTYTLEEFNEKQHRTRTLILQELNLVWTQIKYVTHESCKTSLDLFLRANGFGHDDENAEVDDPEALEKKKKEGQTASIEGEEEKAGEMSYTERATTRTQCRKLTKFIRTAQYLFSDAVASLSRFSTERFLNQMIEYQDKLTGGETKAAEPPGGKAKFGVKTELKPVFSVICEFSIKEISFAPSAIDFRTYIESCLLDSLKAICQNTSFLSEKEFNQFTAPLAELGDAQKEETTDLYTQITSDLLFKRLMMRIGSKMDELFDEVVLYADSFKRFVTMYQENEQMKIEDYSCFEGEEQLEAFRNGFTNYKQQREDIAKIETNKDLGLFRLNSKKMQEFISPSPKRCIDMLQEFVPKLALEQTTEILKKVQADHERLKKPQNNVDEYVEFMTDINVIAEGLTKLNTRCSELSASSA
jgi:dynein heavy chain